MCSVRFPQIQNSDLSLYFIFAASSASRSTLLHGALRGTFLIFYGVVFSSFVTRARNVLASSRALGAVSVRAASSPFSKETLPLHNVDDSQSQAKNLELSTFKLLSNSKAQFLPASEIYCLTFSFVRHIAPQETQSLYRHTSVFFHKPWLQSPFLA